MKLLLLQLIPDSSNTSNKTLSVTSNCDEYEIFEKISRITSIDHEISPDSDIFIIKSINDDSVFVNDNGAFEKSKSLDVETNSPNQESTLDISTSHITIVIYPWNFDILSEKLKNNPALLFDIILYHHFLCSLYKSINTSSIIPMQLLLYGDVVTSTQTILEKNWVLAQHLPHGTIFLASHQTKGRGRSGNKWLSAPGCLQFTTIWDVDTKNRENITTSHSTVVLYQYYAALAMVEAILSIPGYEDLPLKVKWPNDIYCFSDQNTHAISRKLGGVLVQANYINDKSTRLLIGIGLNIDNPKPTYCLNELISSLNLHSTTRELVLAKFSAMFPMLVQKWSLNFDEFQKDYKNRWLHYQRIVYLQENKTHVELIGLRQDGYLLARDCSSNEEIGIQPGSHSLDVGQCVIIPKKTC